MKQDFLKPRLIGQRFDEHTVPLEILKDFAALEEMIIEVAKWKFLQTHPDSKRVQRNFNKGLELHLAQVEEGSAMPAIVLMFSGLFPAENAQYLEQARTDIVEAIHQASQNQTPNLPAHLLGYFDRFGRSLREGEAIEFQHSNTATTQLTPEIRKKLIRSAQVQSWTEETALRGCISEADQAKNSFQLELRDGTKLQAPLAEQHLETVLQAFNHYRDGAHVLLQGVIKKDRQDRLKGFESVEHISLLDPLDVTLRLQELTDLQDGWMDGKGIAPAPAQLNWFATAFENHFDDRLPLPHLYPTAEGGIQAEWSLTDWEITLEINLATQTASYQALNLKTNASRELELSLNKNEDWQQLNDQLVKLGGTQA